MSKIEDIEENRDRLEEKTKVPCPYWLEMIPYTITFVLLTYISYAYIDTQPMEWKYPTFCKLFAIGCIVQWCYLLWERWYFYGPNGFYEIYWYCHMGLLLTAAAIFLHLPSLLGQTMCLTLFPHVSFWVDLMLIPFFKRSVIGSSGWLVEKEYPWHEKLSSMHHFWYFPSILFVIQGQKPLPVSCYFLSIVQFVIMNICSHYMTPVSYIDKNGRLRMLNICVSHECVDFLKPIPPFKWAIGKPYWVHITFATLFYNVPFNYIAYFILLGLQQLMNHFA